MKGVDVFTYISCSSYPSIHHTCTTRNKNPLNMKVNQLLCWTNIYAYSFYPWVNTININIDNTVLSPSSNIKILGVIIDECLTFNEHINIICSNAARQLNAIKRLQCNLDKESRLAIYISYILSNFNYCPLVWHFCGKFKKYGKD